MLGIYFFFLTNWFSHCVNKRNRNQRLLLETFVIANFKCSFIHHFNQFSIFQFFFFIALVISRSLKFIYSNWLFQFLEFIYLTIKLPATINVSNILANFICNRNRNVKSNRMDWSIEYIVACTTQFTCTIKQKTRHANKWCANNNNYISFFSFLFLLLLLCTFSDSYSNLTPLCTHDDNDE